MLAHFIFGITDAIALGAKPGILFWMLTGLITSLFLYERANPESLCEFGLFQLTEKEDGKIKEEAVL